MKVLWIAPNGGCYNNDMKSSGGWVAALESKLTSSVPLIELCIVFMSQSGLPEKKMGNVTYMPINVRRHTFFLNWINHTFFRYHKIDRKTNNIILSKIDMFKPDIVHIWGTETFPIGIISQLRVPAVVHIQGFASSIIKTYMPLGYNKENLKECDGFLDCHILKKGDYFFYKYGLYRASEEVKYSKSVKYWIGRTEWDKETSKILNPNSQYFHCDELMRDIFTTASWRYHYKDHLNIMTTIGESWYKGIEQILQVAKILKEMNESFTWRVCGINEKSKIAKYFQKKTGIFAKQVNITFLGNLSANDVCKELLASDVYVHTSHIENSSNAISEAMSLGVPVVAEFVGGNPTIVNTGGILVQPYSPNNMASAIIKMKCQEMANRYSAESRTIATERHNSNRVVESLIDIYFTVFNINNK